MVIPAFGSLTPSWSAAVAAGRRASSAGRKNRQLAALACLPYFVEEIMRLQHLGFLTLVLSTVLTLSAQQRPASERAVQRIQKEVRHELLMLPYLDVFDNLAFKVEGYKVTLLGQVTRPSIKSDAERAVKDIEGVEQVDNQIEVLPPSPNDDRLRRQLFRAIYGYGPLQRYDMGVIKPIRIIVKNGHVTLEGVVDSQADKDTAGIRANGVSGVFSVTNDLRVVKS
jgi:hyperosmotically inducible protein